MFQTRRGLLCWRLLIRHARSHQSVNMTNSVVWKKRSGQNLPSKSNPPLRRGSINYKINCIAPAHLNCILTSPVLQNPIHFYVQNAVELKKRKFTKATDLNPNQNNNRKKGKHHTRFMREKNQMAFLHANDEYQWERIQYDECALFPLCY